MQVVEDDDERSGLGGGPEEGGDGVEESEAGLFRFELRSGLESWQLGFDVGDDLCDVCGPCTHLGAEPLGFGVPDVASNGLDPRPVWRDSLFFVAPSPQDPRAPEAGVCCQFL